MYLSYYKLNRKPFQISTDPDFFWIGEKNKEALSILKYGVESNKGFLLLTGDVGTGKTTLLNAFVNSLGDEVIIARVPDPEMTKLGFMKYMAEMFKMDTDFETKGEFLILFTKFLEQAHIDNKEVLLIIDEAQQLTAETLEEIRLLSNIERQDTKLINILLVGQNEFHQTLEKTKNRALRQRLAINYTLYPFGPDETKACIKYRLAVAGAQKEIFTPEAIAAVHTLSQGFPRVINIICDHALRIGSLEEQETISKEIVNKCAKEVHFVGQPQLHKHDELIDSTDDWLEDTELPPLTVEALLKASQPLPDPPTEPQPAPQKKSRKHITVPLLIVILLLSGIFVFIDDKLETITQYIVNSIKETIASTLKEEEPVNVTIKSTKKTVAITPLEVTPNSDVTKTAAPTEDDTAVNEPETLPPPAAGSTPQEIKPPPSVIDSPEKLDKPGEKPATAKPTTEDDPSAIIDWLLKSKQNQ